MIRCSLLLLTLTLSASAAMGATISSGDVTSNLDGDIFFDDARTGGGDATYGEGTVNNVQRFFDFDADGLITDPPGAGVVTIQSFGFATSGSATANDATEIDLTFIYLGADENPGTAADNVVIGSERVGYNHTGGGEYFVDFDTDPSALIDGLGSRFRIVVEVVDNNPGIVENIRFKTRPNNEQSFFGQGPGHSGPTWSLSGSFVPAIPEPGAALLAGFGLVASAVRRRG